jgi:hypothetical protein
VSGYAADEEASGFFVQSDWSAEKAREQGRQGTDRHESTTIFDQKLPAEIGVAALHFRASFSCLKFSFDAVVAQAPARSVNLGAYLAKRVEQFEKADVIAAIVLDERQRVIGGHGIDREMFFGRGGREKEGCGKDKSETSPPLPQRARQEWGTR